MSATSRTEQRDDLMTSLGLLVDPIRRLVFGDDDPVSMIPYIRSQYYQDEQVFRLQATNYCRPGNHKFEMELDRICREVGQFPGFLDGTDRPENRERARMFFLQRLAAAQEAIRAVPCNDPGIVLPASSPLQTYYRLRSVCAAAGKRLELFDPYLNADVFHRYLRDVAASASLTVVTSEQIMVYAKSAKEIQRRDQIVAVSRLVAAERPATYRFLVTAQQHDRHLRIDNEIMHLGNSIKDASAKAPYTISNLPPSTHGTLDALVLSSTVWFEPNMKADEHRAC